MNLCRLSNRGKQNCQLVPGATVGDAVPKMAEWRVRVRLLAAELPSLPAGGGSRCRNAEKSFAFAAVDHTGESWFISRPRTNLQHTEHKHKLSTPPTASLNSKPLCSACQPCRSEFHMGLSPVTHSYLPQPVSGVLPVDCVNRFLSHLILFRLCNYTW